MQSDEEYKVENSDDVIARSRALFRQLSLIPDARVGLNSVQIGCFGVRYNHPGQLLYARYFPFIGERSELPLHVVYLEFFRLIQQVAIFPLFERLIDYDWLIHFPSESTEAFQSHTFQDFLQSQQFPELTQFGRDMFKDRPLCNITPPPVCLPLHLVSGVCFDNTATGDKSTLR